MGKWAYDSTFTDYPNQVKRRRHAVCEWVKSNWEEKIQEYLYGGWNTTRCLGELGARIDPSGRYTPGTPCSGHGRCTEDKMRDSTRTTLAEIAAAAAAAQPQFVDNQEETVVPTEEEVDLWNVHIPPILARTVYFDNEFDIELAELDASTNNFFDIGK